MSWGIVASVGGAVIGGALSSSGSRDAANTQADAARDASATELEMFNRNRKDMEPWRRAGRGALSQLTRGTRPGGEYMQDFGMDDFEADPGYEFRQTEGRRSIEGGAASRGGLLSGATLKALAKYGQGVASEEYGNAYNRYNADLDRRFNRLSGIAGTGQTATRDVAQLGAQTASNVAQNQLGAGNARASGYVGQANAVTGAINNGVQGYQLSQLLRQPAGGSAGGSSWGTPGLNNFFYGSGGSGD